MYLTWGYRQQRRNAYNEAFHTYGLEWNENYMWTCKLSYPSFPLLSTDIQTSTAVSAKSSRSVSTSSLSGNAATSPPPTPTARREISSVSTTPGSTRATTSRRSIKSSTSPWTLPSERRTAGSLMVKARNPGSTIRSRPCRTSGSPRASGGTTGAPIPRLGALLSRASRCGRCAS